MDEVTTKQCTKCGEVKVLDAFGMQKTGKYGRVSRCKDCLRKYRQENKQKISESNRRYRQENKERLAKYFKDYRQENRQRITEQKRKYSRPKNISGIDRAEYIKKYHQENKHQITARKKAWYQKNKEKILIQQREYSSKTKEKRIEYLRKYRKENPGVARRHQHKRRAMKRSLPHLPLTSAQHKYLYDFRNRLFGTTSLEADNFDLDHFIPLACGWGADYFFNVSYIPSTWNRSKQARHPFEWADWYFEQPDAFGTRTQFDTVVQEIADRNGITIEYLREVCDWAFANPRTAEEAKLDANIFGRVDAIGAYRAVQKTKQELSEILGTTEDTEWITKLIA